MTRTQFELPDCFDSWSEWDSWKTEARRPIQPEQASICDDCTTDHEAKMAAAWRCDRRGWSIVMFGPRVPVAKKALEATS